MPAMCNIRDQHPSRPTHAGRLKGLRPPTSPGAHPCWAHHEKAPQAGLYRPTIHRPACGGVSAGSGGGAGTSGSTGGSAGWRGMYAMPVIVFTCLLIGFYAGPPWRQQCVRRLLHASRAAKIAAQARGYVARRDTATVATTAGATGPYCLHAGHGMCHAIVQHESVHSQRCPAPSHRARNGHDPNATRHHRPLLRP